MQPERVTVPHWHSFAIASLRPVAFRRHSLEKKDDTRLRHCASAFVSKNRSCRIAWLFNTAPVEPLEAMG
jgi:hypothetical protein